MTISSVAYVKRVDVKRPSSGTVIGQRLKAAHPNRAGNAFGKPTVSFAKKYMIMESSDHSDIGDTELQAFLDKLRSMGFDTIQFV